MAPVAKWPKMIVTVKPTAVQTKKAPNGRRRTVSQLEHTSWRAWHAKISHVMSLSGEDPGILKGEGGGGGGGISSKRGGPTPYSGAICIANKQNLVKKRGGGPDPLDTPPGSAVPDFGPAWVCPWRCLLSP